MIEDFRKIAVKYGVELGVIGVQLSHPVDDRIRHAHQYLWMLGQTSELSDLVLANRLMNIYQHISSAALNQIVESLEDTARSAHDSGYAEDANNIREVRDVLSTLSEHIDRLFPVFSRSVERLGTELMKREIEEDAEESDTQESTMSEDDVLNALMEFTRLKKRGMLN
jgi:hypothetical protein